MSSVAYATRAPETSTHDAEATPFQQPYVEQSRDDAKLAEKIVKRQGQLEDERSLIDAFWNLVDEIITPRRAVWDLGSRRGMMPGEKLGAEVYDQTCSSAGQDFADGLQGQTASAGLVWWAIHFQNKLAQKDYMARQWIDEVQELAAIEMANSNFYSQYNEACQDGVFFGIATMAKPIWLPFSHKLSYQAHHNREIFVARDDNGEINLWHRKFPMQNRQIDEKFGLERLDYKLRQEIEKNPFQRRMVIHSLYLNTERDTRKWTSENKRVASVYVLENEKLILRKSGFDDWPLSTWCFRRNSQEDYGRGPAMDSIFEAASVNSAVHYLMDAAQLAVMKPLVAQESLKNKIKISPWGITWLQAGEPAPTELFHGAGKEYPIGVDQVMKMREELREKFKAKTFQLLSYLTQMTSRMNQMQIAEIQGEKAAALIPIVGPGQSELLIPMIRSTLQVLFANGRLPPPPPSILAYDPSTYFEFLGPIAVAIKRYLQMQGINPFLLRLIGDRPLIDVWPELKDKMKADELYDYLFEADGAPSKIDQDPDTLIKIRQAKLQQIQQEQRMQQLERLAGGYKQVQGAPEPGSPGEKLMGGQGGQQ
jgi:hypothetical protein